MRYAPRALLAGGLGFAVSLLAACGGGAGLLNADQANSLNSQLDQVSSAVDSGQCGAVANAAVGLTNAVENLPASISPTLVSNLKQGATTVSRLAAKDCHTQSTTPTTPTTSTATTNTTTTPTTTTQSPPSTTTAAPPTTSTATTTTPSGTTSTGGGSGGAGLGGGGGSGGGTGGAGTGNGNGNGNGNGP
jgi:hypothetical protein